MRITAKEAKRLVEKPDDDFEERHLDFLCDSIRSAALDSKYSITTLGNVPTPKSNIDWLKLNGFEVEIFTDTKMKVSWKEAQL